MDQMLRARGSDTKFDRRPRDHTSQTPSQPLDIMAPTLTKRGSVSSETSPTAEPSTWKVLVAVGSAGWITYSLWHSATAIWHWLQWKIQRHNGKKALAEAELQQKVPIQKRHTKVLPTHRRIDVNGSSCKNGI